MSDYGSLGGVGLLARKYANDNQTFTSATIPTANQVETWLSQVCSQLNACLADARFGIPVTAVDVIPLLDMFVNRQVASMVEALHLSHRAGPLVGQNTRGVTVADILAGLPGASRAFIQENAGGIEAMGAGRGTSQTRMGSVAMIRVDGYSDDQDSWEID